jgi:hypothetical protein
MFLIIRRDFFSEHYNFSQVKAGLNSAWRQWRQQTISWVTLPKLSLKKLSAAARQSSG